MRTSRRIELCGPGKPLLDVTGRSDFEYAPGVLGEASPDERSDHRFQILEGQLRVALRPSLTGQERTIAHYKVRIALVMLRSPYAMGTAAPFH